VADDTALHGLYPFLHGGDKDPRTEQAALLESVSSKAADSVVVKKAFFDRHARDVIAVARAIADCYRNGGVLFSMGNGGSSCDASHIAVEFQHPVTAGRPALPAINLTVDTAMMTAVGNDIGFAHIFLRQLEAKAKPGDCLVGFSTSGDSDNLMAAFTKARQMGLTTIGLAGMSGGAMAAKPSRRSLPRRGDRQRSPHSGVSPDGLPHPVGPGAHPAGRPARVGRSRAMTEPLPARRRSDPPAVNRQAPPLEELMGHRQ
jgi:D-sedoheptulose 7-phosphate isomerase